MNKLYLGVAREIITPEVGCHLLGYNADMISTSVADDLTVTALCFKQGDTRAMLLSATVCEISTDIATAIREQVSSLTGIPVGHIMLSATHTHSGPVTLYQEGWGNVDVPYVENIFTPGILKAAQRAVADLQPVTVGMAQGNSFVGINRRELTMNNGIKLGQNEWGPFNPRMTVLSFRGENGSTVANLIHYGCHGTSAGHNHEITRDWSGLMTDALEEKTGAITAYFNGAEGDVGPRISNGKTVGDDTMTYVYELGKIAARDALNIYSQICEFTDMELRATACDVCIPLKPRMDRELAAQELEEYKNDTWNWRALKRQHLENVLRAYETGEPEETHTCFPQTLIALGCCVLVSFPYELFAEIDLRICKACPEQTVLSVNVTNGTYSYFITEDAVCRGGYEVNMFLYANPQTYCDNADFELIKATVNNINNFIAS